MNKGILLSLFLGLTVLYSNAQQISLGGGDFPTVGLNLEIYECQSTGPPQLTDSVTLGVGGPADNTMDFSKATQFVVDTTNWSYVTPASTGWAANHPTANVALFEGVERDSATGDTVLIFYEFYNSTPNDFILVGITILIDTAAVFGGSPPTGNMDTVHAPFNPTDTIVNSSYALGYMGSDSSYLSVVFSPLEHRERVAKDIEVDGWGMLTHPNGTFNVLRVKVTQKDSSNDYIFGIPVDTNVYTDYYFEYWAKGVGHPVVIAETDFLFSNVWRVKYVNVIPTAVIENDLEVTAELYPNPASREVTLEIHTLEAQDVNLVLYNAIGQRMLSKTIRIDNYYKETIDLSGYNNGIYHLLIQNQKGQNLFAKELVLTR